MGAARSQLRLLQSERAYRRASAALEDLKRARDPLRDPAQVLEELVRDALQIGAGAGVLAEAKEPPPWLSGALLEQTETVLAERSAELAGRLEKTPGQGASADAKAVDAARFVTDAGTAFRAALAELQGQRFAASLQPQRRGIEALLEARERLLALRPLLELVYRDERAIQASLDGKLPEDTPELPLPALRELQQRNVDRGERLAALLAADKARAEAPAAPGTEASADAKQLETLKKRVALAEPLLARARARMDGASGLLAKGQKVGARASVASAVQELALLRRLFFSIVEQVRDTAERQLELGDATRDLGALARPDELRERTTPIAKTQGELADQSGAIADTLEEQSRQAVGGPAQEPQAEQARDQLRRAGEQMLGAQTAMREALGAFARDPVALDDAKASQQTALEKLAEALKLLSPPGEPPPKNDSKQDQQKQNDQSEKGQGGQGEKQDAARDPGQMLQSVRDRDAQRRRAQAQQQDGAGPDRVERDW
jgi:hypothetical protein